MKRKRKRYGQCGHQTMRKAVFIAECKATSCIGCIAESILDFDGRPREVGECENRDRRKGPGVRQGASRSSNSIRDLVAS